MLSATLLKFSDLERTEIESRDLDGKLCKLCHIFFDFMFLCPSLRCVSDLVTWTLSTQKRECSLLQQLVALANFNVHGPRKRKLTVTKQSFILL